MSDEHPIAAIATALVPSAIAVIRCTGQGCIEILAKLFSDPPRLRSAEGHTLTHGSLSTPSGEPLDEVIIATYRRPKSYTGEESAELYCHGSPAGVRRILACLLSVGFDAANPGEFTRRAFLNGKLDLTRSEAVNELVRAQTATAHGMALDRLAGSVERTARTIRSELVALMSQLAIQLDYPEEEIGEFEIDRERLSRCQHDLAQLAATYQSGRIYQHGVSVALAGRTNAGKSALFNRLLQQDRSIVSDLHGTTRDYLEALIDIWGIPVRLFDTAGMRPSDGEIEKEGIRRSEMIIASADLALYVVDAVIGLTDDDDDRIETIRKTSKTLVVINKIDLATAGSSEIPVPFVQVSAETGTGIPDLETAIKRAVLGEGVRDIGGVTIDSERQCALFSRAAESVGRTLDAAANGVPPDALAVDLQDAIGAVGEITGEVASAEILDAMFDSFCVGK